MYVQWLLEFVWRIFIQGPLLFIDFFTKKGNLNQLSSLIRFNLADKNLNDVLGHFASIGIFIAFGAVLLIMIFIFKIIKIIVVSKTDENKALIIEALKAFGKSFAIILVFVIIFNLFFSFFNILAGALNKHYNAIVSKNSNNMFDWSEQFSGNIINIVNNPGDILHKFNNEKSNSNGVFEISNIPDKIYELITNEPLKHGKNNSTRDEYFLFPDKDFLSKMDTINWLVSIIFVISFAWFLLWIVWSVFQKIIEIFFLYLTFPISIGFSLNSNQIHWKIWVKEIINKTVIIFGLMLFLWLFLVFFNCIEINIINGSLRFNNAKNAKLILSLFITLAFGSAMMFILKLFSRNSKEHIGVFGVASSFKQTRNFISNNSISNNNNSYQTNNVNNEEIINQKIEPVNNGSVEYLKNDISNSKGPYNRDYLILEKAKVFKQ